MDNIIENYTWNILKKQLQKYKVTSSILYKIIDNVKMQLNSLIYNIRDEEFFNAILILGSEEGTFYEPKCERIANMVVVGIRNSLLEGIASSSYLEYGANCLFEDNYIKDITSTAIEYFSKYDLKEISKTMKLEYDFYREIAIKYPVAFNSLKELSKCTINDLEHKYERISFKEPYELEELNIKSDPNDVKTKNIESGISTSFNNSLIEFLKGFKEKKSKVFVTDSFKMTTRNFEKMLRILEFILTHDGIYMTCNYLITPDYVSRRKELLRAGHDEKDFFKKIDKLKDVSKNYDGIKNIQNFL